MLGTWCSTGLHEVRQAFVSYHLKREPTGSLSLPSLPLRWNSKQQPGLPEKLAAATNCRKCTVQSQGSGK